MQNLSSKEIAILIDKALHHLKAIKITQSIIADRINYTSLSKAKNFDVYPQVVIEKKTRREVLDMIFKEFNLQYDLHSDTFIKAEWEINDEKNTSLQLHYVLYYYSYVKENIGKGYVNITNNKNVLIEFNDPNHTLSVWKGSFEVIENFTFFSVEKRGKTTPIKALYSFFSGTMKYGRPFLLGTYCTVKRDGLPTAGEAFMEKVKDKKTAIIKIENDTDPRIASYLFDTNFTVSNFTPTSLEELPDTESLENYTGEYTCLLSDAEKKILHGSFTIHPSSKTFFCLDNIKLNGSSKKMSDGLIFSKLKPEGKHFHQSTITVHAYLHFNFGKKPKNFISGLFLSTGLIDKINSIPVLLFRKGTKISEKSITNYFNKLPTCCIPNVDFLD